MNKNKINWVAVLTMMFLFGMISFVTNLAAPIGTIWKQAPGIEGSNFWGFAGYQEDLSAYGGAYLPIKQPVWYLNYNAEEGYLSLKTGELLTNLFSFGVEEAGENVLIAAGQVDAEGKLKTDHDYQIKATWNKEMNTITFEKGYYICATVWGAGSGDYYGYWKAYGDVVMTRK